MERNSRALHYSILKVGILVTRYKRDVFAARASQPLDHVIIIVYVPGADNQTGILFTCIPVFNWSRKFTARQAPVPNTQTNRCFSHCESCNKIGNQAAFRPGPNQLWPQIYARSRSPTVHEGLPTVCHGRLWLGLECRPDAQARSWAVQASRLAYANYLAPLCHCVDQFEIKFLWDITLQNKPSGTFLTWQRTQSDRPGKS